MPRLRRDYRGLANASRLRLLHAIQENPDRTIKQLATASELHVNTVRDHLRVLLDEGLVAAASQRTGRRGRPQAVFRAVDRDTPTRPAQARVETARRRGEVLRRFVPDSGPAALSGSERLQVDLVYDHLDDLGLKPRPLADDLRISLTPCPFVQRASDDPALTCAVHTRLLRDTLAQAPGEVELDALKPFVRWNECHVVLHRRPARPLGPAQSTATPTSR